MTSLHSVLAATILVSTAAWAQSPWIIRHAGSPPLNGVAASDRLVIAVGDSGTLLSSPNGETWKLESVPTSQASLTSVGFGGGIWVASTSDGTLLKSTDGAQWFKNGQPLPRRVTAFAFNTGMFVAISDGSPWYSADGENWTRVAEINRVSPGILAVGGGRFLAAQLNFSAGSILESTDGIHWAEHPRPAEIIYSIGYGGDRYLVIGIHSGTGVGTRSFSSTDLTNWTPGGALSGLRPGALAFSEGIHVAAGGGPPEMSVDGSAWSPGGATGPGVIRAMVPFAGHFIAVNFDGSIRQSPDLLSASMAHPGVVRISGPGGGRYEIRAQDALQPGTSWPRVGEVNLQSVPLDWTDPEADAHTDRWYRVEGPF